MKTTHTIIIGAGQAGLAMSRCLSERSIEHVVFERARVAERWRSERWDSLRLLTPNWMSRLPGYAYEGTDPDGFMTMPEVIRFLEQYALLSRAPVETDTNVVCLKRSSSGFQLETNKGWWRACNVVVATGYCDRPAVPKMSRRLSKDIVQLSPVEYRNPGQLPEGGVLIVGAAASGIQLADELAAAGRSVTIAAGRHTRMPRRYRGQDILWWLDQMGILDQTADQVYNLETSRQQPAFQLVGRPDFSSIDLARLSKRGVRVVGRALDSNGYRMEFADDLAATTTAADVKLASLLARIERFLKNSPLEQRVGAFEPFVPSWPSFISRPTPAALDFRAEGIDTVVWATGFRRSYPWLQVPVLDSRGDIRHSGGITPEPGLYVLGMQFQKRRNSAFIDGVGQDAAELADHIALRAAAHPAAVA